MVLGFSVFSHFLLDLPMHPPDLALWPGSSIHLGFGLWKSMPVGYWWVELWTIALENRARGTAARRTAWCCGRAPTSSGA